MIVEEKDLKEGELPVNKIIHGDTLTVLKKLPSNSVDCIITSPPYWSKRNYGEETCRVWGGDPNCDHEFTETFCKKCGAWYGQLGLEPTPELYVEHLIEIFREVKRVLKPHGNLFVVIDDSYIGSNQGFGASNKSGFQWVGYGYYAASNQKPPTALFKGAPRKSMALVPELFAVKMVYELGFILRQKIIWTKKVLLYKDMKTIGNAMPESVRDRNTHTYEFVYHFVKCAKYYYNQLRIQYKGSSIERLQRAESLINRSGLPLTEDSKYYNIVVNGSLFRSGLLTARFIKTNSNCSVQATLEEGNSTSKYNGTAEFTFADNLGKIRDTMRKLGLPECNPLGSNSPDVILINPEPFRGAHFAVFPTRLVELLISLGCPEKVCSECGKPYEKVYEVDENSDVDVDWNVYGANNNGEYFGQSIKDYSSAKAQDASEVKRRILKSLKKRVFVELRQSCNCNSGTVAGIVMDIFGGSGTTGLVALRMNRRFILIELNSEYCEIASNRLKPYLSQTKLS